MDYNEKVIRSRYQLVPRSLVFIVRGDEILFIHKEKSDSFGFEKLNGIGGHIEKGEEPYEAARREVKEETGLDIDLLELLAVIFIEIGINPGILLFVFRGDYMGGKLLKSEEGSLIWINKEEVKQMPNIVKDIPFLLDLLQKHKKGTSPKYLKYLYNKDGELRIVI